MLKTFMESYIDKNSKDLVAQYSLQLPLCSELIYKVPRR